MTLRYLLLKIYADLSCVDSCGCGSTWILRAGSAQILNKQDVHRTAQACICIDLLYIDMHGYAVLQKSATCQSVILHRVCLPEYLCKSTPADLWRSLDLLISKDLQTSNFRDVLLCKLSLTEAERMPIA